MGTFHALCARVLRRDGAAIGIDPRFAIYDTDDQAGIVKQVLRDLELQGTGELRPAAVLSAISRWKNDMVSPVEADEQAQGYLESQFAKAYARYTTRLRAASGLDFDDLLIEAVRLFDEAPAVLAHYQQRWRYLHVDEYQDTNRAQYLWVKALARQHRNLAVVGDDAPSIYSWRGADLRNILDFEADYPDATVVKLEQNYRSTQLILDAAHAVVARNEDRKDKKLWTQNPRGQLIERFEADREDEEAEWVARQIEALAAGRGSAGSVLSRRADDGDGEVPKCAASTPQGQRRTRWGAPSCAATRALLHTMRSARRLASRAQKRWLSPAFSAAPCSQGNSWIVCTRTPGPKHGKADTKECNPTSPRSRTIRGRRSWRQIRKLSRADGANGTAVMPGVSCSAAMAAVTTRTMPGGWGRTRAEVSKPILIDRARRRLG
jgi:hypothetical protein